MKLKCVSIQFPDLSRFPHYPFIFYTSTRMIFLLGASAHDCRIHRSHPCCETAWLSLHCGRGKEGGQRTPQPLIVFCRFAKLPAFRCAQSTVKTCPSGAVRRCEQSASKRTGGVCDLWRGGSSVPHMLFFCFHRGASAVAECQGMYKMQHDLDKVLAAACAFLQFLLRFAPKQSPAAQNAMCSFPSGSQVHACVPAHMRPLPADGRGFGRWRSGGVR